MNTLTRLLYIEVNEEDAKNFRREIEKSTLSIALTIVSTLDELFKEVEKNKFDIIFSDYHLPHETGLQFLKKS